MAIKRPVRENFSFLETDQGNYRLSTSMICATGIYILGDKDFAPDGGLLPKRLNWGKLLQQFTFLAEITGINSKASDGMVTRMRTGSEQVEQLILRLSCKGPKRNYLQAYQGWLCF